MSDCGWCGKVITGEYLSIEISSMTMNVGETENEMPGYIAEFCCHGCAWAFSVEYHRLISLSGKDLRTHLIEVHGLIHPPGKPAGGMRRDCLVMDMAKRLASFLV
jgi:hypothetical protein